MRVVWSERADRDLLSIEDHLLSAGLQDKKVDQIIDDLISATDLLELWPYSGRMVPELNDPDFREVIHKPWRIIYTVGLVGDVEVQNVVHTSQQLGKIGK